MSCIIVLCGKLNAQWTNNTTWFNTPSTLQSVGVGNFTALPAARFEVSNWKCASPSGALSGYLFRTDGVINVENKWQMCIGSSPSNINEVFKLFVPNNSFDVESLL